MKQFIHDITHFQWQDGQAAFVGQDGKVILTFLNPLCVKVEYRFEGAEIKPLSENASRWILSGASSSRTCEISDHGDFFLAEAENGLSVQVEKRRALVSVLYKGQLVHGGAFRNPDLVVPAYPVRLLKDGQHLVARFNFPAEPEDEFYGLGDKGGLPNRRGRRFSMFNRDSLGYDAANSDPLYKSIPFYLKINRKAQSLCGVLFPETLIRVMDFGRNNL
ncbi:MAG: hypothetical protein EOM66_12275 [Clostridia bacterium]|nr:hypothetical protein [Clostridia bacterium]